MADLEDGEIVDSSDEEMKNEGPKPTENGLNVINLHSTHNCTRSPMSNMSLF